ncbi:MAG: hypothetical protein R6V05_01180 [Candidatus Brocadiia bacterium]
MTPEIRSAKGTSWRSIITACGLCAGLIFVAVLALASQGKEPQLLDEIVQEATARQSAVETLRYEWETEETLQVGLVPGWDPTGGVVAPSGQPGGERTLNQRWVLAIEGQRARYQQEGEAFHLQQREPVPVHETGFWANGKLRANYNQQEESVTEEPLWAGLSLRPVLEAYRLFDQEMGPADRDAVTVLRRDQYGGHPCVVVQWLDTRGDGESGTPWHWWLAEDMDYCVVRSQVLTEPGGWVLQEARMSYEPDPDPRIGWRLASWEGVWYHGPGQPRASFTARVSEASLNVPVTVEP